MFDSLKNFFGKFKKQPPGQPAAPPPTPPAAQPAKKSAPAPAPAKPAAPAAKPAPTAAPPRPTAAAPAAPEPVSAGGDETISLPLKPILAKLPSTLSALVKSPSGGEVSVSLSKVMKQLPQGSVKVTFGELRTAAPMGTFLEVASQDQTLVELPLPEILSRISPGLLTRRTPQKVLDAPAEVGNLFGNRGETLPQPSAPTSAPAPAAAPAAPKAPVAPAPAPARPAAPMAPAAPKVPAAPIAPKTSVPIPAPNIPKPPSTVPKPTAPAPAAPIPAPNIPAPNIPAPNIPRPAAPAPPASPKIPMPAPAAPKMPEPVAARGDSTQYFLNKDTVAADEIITIPLASLMDNWPDPVKDEAKKAGLENSSVAFPMGQLEAPLKSGKIVFPWKQIAAWIKPTPPVATLQGETVVELPLKVIAPLFIQLHRPIKAQKKVSIGENIPDIFSGGAPVPAKPAAAPAASAPAAPAPVAAPAAPIPAPAIPKPAAPIPAPAIPKPATPIPAPSIPKPAVPVPSLAPAAAKEPTTLGEVFGQADKKDWSPNEVVQKTSALKGMSGALIVTTDGLLVAGQMPAPYKADSIGAFLPQIFVRMNQYGKELQVGEMNCMQVEFNKTPWYIVKLGHIYFGAVGKSGETFPTSLLKVIASELEKPNR